MQQKLIRPKTAENMLFDIIKKITLTEVTYEFGNETKPFIAS